MELIIGITIDHDVQSNGIGISEFSVRTHHRMLILKTLFLLSTYPNSPFASLPFHRPPARRLLELPLCSHKLPLRQPGSGSGGSRLWNQTYNIYS